MFTAFVMIQAERRRMQEVARRLAETPGVEEVYSVTGEWDIIAVLRLKDYDELAEIELIGVSGQPAVAGQEPSKRKSLRVYEHGIEGNDRGGGRRRRDRCNS